MIKISRLLKSSWVKRQIELSLPLLTSGTRIKLIIDGDCLFTTDQSSELKEGAPGIIIQTLNLQDEIVGTLLLLPLSGDEDHANTWGNALIHALQGKLDAEHVRRLIGQETLESYREIALLQRGMTSFNHSIEPTAILTALLKEVCGTAEYGAIFFMASDDDEPTTPTLALSFGNHSDAAFFRLQHTAQFATMAACHNGDIINNFPSSTTFRSLLWLPLIAYDKKLGLLVLASTRVECFSAADMKRAQPLVAVAAIALRNVQLFTAEQDIELAFLRAQINPHFLHNTLNSIISLSRDDVDFARRLLTHLSDFLRNSFDFWCKDHFAPLYAEIELVQNWLIIEQARFEHLVNVRFDIHADRRHRVPVAMIQPIVENALHHGILAQQETGNIDIRINEAATGLEFYVSDDGAGFDICRPRPSTRPSGRQGIGLSNIDGRLFRLYGTHLNIDSALGQGTRINWFIPFSASS